MEPPSTPRRRRRDPGAALRLAVRQDDDSKVAALIDFLLKRVPLQWDADGGASDDDLRQHSLHLSIV